MFLNPTWLRKPKIFVSSTMEDKNNIYRQKIIKNMKDMGFDILDFQDSNFPHSIDSSSEVIQDSINAVKAADIFILLIGQRYGTIYREQKSVIHCEYEEAIANNIPLLILIQSNVWRDALSKRQQSEYFENEKHFQFIKELSKHRMHPFQDDEECVSHIKTIFNNYLGGFFYFAKLADWLWDKDKTIEAECSSSEIWIITPDFYYDFSEPEKFEKVKHNVVDRKCMYRYIYKSTQQNEDRITEMKRVYGLSMEKRGADPKILDDLLYYLPVSNQNFVWATEQIIFNPFRLSESAITVDIMGSRDKTTRFNIEFSREKRIEFRGQFITYWNNNIQDTNKKIRLPAEGK